MAPGEGHQGRRPGVLIIGLVGYVASWLMLLMPSIAGESGIAWLYALRGMTGFFVAAVVPVVAASVAEHTPQERRARRFA